MDFITDLISLKELTTVFVGAFFVCFVGYAVGAIKVKGINLGTAGVFLFALLFGYLCTMSGLAEIPVLGKFFMSNAQDSKLEAYGIISDIGLIMFVTSVGSIAGPKFFRDLKKNAKTYVPMGALIITIGALVTVLIASIDKIGPSYATGILSGALTSTPAFSAAKETAANPALVILGQAVAYPFGVIGVVLFVQIMPKLLKADIAKERELISATAVNSESTQQAGKKKLALDDFGFAAFGLVLVLGLLLGSVKIPLSGKGFDGPTFSLGSTGGPLIVALIIGHFGNIGPISMKMNVNILKGLREFGLMLFLLGAGVEGGVVLVDQIGQNIIDGWTILYGFIAGIVITIVPMVVGYVFARYICKLPLLSNLGSITGGMTSTPALGTLIGVAGTDDVAGAYAATYPIALVLVVLAGQLINTLMV